MLSRSLSDGSVHPVLARGAPQVNLRCCHAGGMFFFLGGVSHLMNGASHRIGELLTLGGITLPGQSVCLFLRSIMASSFQWRQTSEWLRKRVMAHGLESWPVRLWFKCLRTL